MALFNYATRELSAKIVYYGPGLSGKTTNIEKVHELLKPGQKGKLISLPTETDRTLFFDFLPVQLGKIKGFNVRFHLYTVPGQVFYNATRRLVLQGVDGVVFVADSQEGMRESNLESLRNLEENLATYGKRIEELPFLIQFNKRDLPRLQPAEEMNASLNRLKAPTCEASALTGQGVIETLSAISRLVFQHLRGTLLMPGEAAVDEVEERFGEAFGAPAPAAPPPEATEELEEIADLEEIPEGREGYTPPPPPEAFPSRFGEAIPFPPGDEEEGAVPDEIELPGTEGEAGEAPPAAAPAPGEEEYRFEELDRIEVELPGDEGAPSPAEPPAGLPTPESLAPPVPEPLGSGLEWTPSGSAKVFPAPEPVPEPAPAPEPGAAPEAAPPEGPAFTVPPIRVEAEEGSSLTFLRFEAPSVSEEGHALLPLVFLDGDGNTVRIRLRISMEGR